MPILLIGNSKGNAQNYLFWAFLFVESVLLLFHNYSVVVAIAID